jgi:hypothetical protein
MNKIHLKNALARTLDRYRVLGDFATWTPVEHSAGSERDI